MKLKSLRCQICDHWYGAFRNHCPACGSTRGMKMNGRIFHFDVGNGMRQVVKGFFVFRFSGKDFSPERSIVVDKQG